MRGDGHDHLARLTRVLLCGREKEIGGKERETGGKGNRDGDYVRVLDPVMKRSGLSAGFVKRRLLVSSP